MTERRSFKRLVRARMDKTGESYTAARAALLAGRTRGQPADAPVLPLSDEAVMRRTGRSWEAWFDLLDAWGATQRTHGEVARWVTEEHDVDGWSAQAVTVAYERARGGRAVGQTRDGFSVGASRTVAVPVERLFDAFVDEQLRPRWLPDAPLRARTATRPRTARYDWGDGTTRVVVGFEAKGEAKSVVAVQHERLPDADEADRRKAYWRERLTALKAVLEG